MVCICGQPNVHRCVFIIGIVMTVILTLNIVLFIWQPVEERERLDLWTRFGDSSPLINLFVTATGIENIVVYNLALVSTILLVVGNRLRIAKLYWPFIISMIYNAILLVICGFVELFVFAYYLRKNNDSSEMFVMVVISTAFDLLFNLLVISSLCVYFATTAYKGYCWLMERKGCEKMAL